MVKHTSSEALQFVTFIAILRLITANLPFDKSGLCFDRKNMGGSSRRMRHAAFSFMDGRLSSRRSDTDVRKKPSYGTITRRDTSLQFKIELFPSVFGDGWKKKNSEEEYITEQDEPALPTWAKGLASTEKVGNRTKLSNMSKKIFNAKNVKFLMRKKGEDAINLTPEEAKAATDTKMPLVSLMEVNDLLMASGQESTIRNESKYNPSNEIDDDAYQPIRNTYGKESVTEQNPLGIIPTVEELGDWENFVLALQSSIKDLLESPAQSPSFDLSVSAEQILKEATQKIESILNDASTSFSPEKVQEMITKASFSLAVDENADVFKTTMDRVVATAETMARDKGLDVSEAAEQARATTNYTAKFLQAANGVLLSGYVSGGVDRGDLEGELAKKFNIPLSEQSENVKPLFGAYKSARSIPKSEYIQTVEIGADMAELAGGIYLDTNTVTDKLGHAIVANGTTADVAWMVTDSIGYEQDYISSIETATERKPILIRTVTIRGYDASDDTVDRERLMNRLCTANPVLLGEGNKNVFFHGGLLDVAEEIYSQISPLIELAGPTHKIVFNGHSIGGSLALLLLFLLTEYRGDSFVREKVLRTFTFGAIPIAFSDATEEVKEEMVDCPILRSYGLPTSIVYGYVQPWDPIVRLFSPIDAMYPLVGDLGEDGVSLYASGPNRALRPILRSILESWEGWPNLRENLLGSAVVQDYESVGTQHLLLPDPSRYLTDRLLTVNVGAPPLEEVIRISPGELYAALEEVFPLDTFSISFVPAAIRSFIHHFYPAYEQGLTGYVEKETAKEKEILSQSSLLNTIP